MISLFFSYSHKDEAYRDELEKHLSILKRNGVITTWHDRRIEPGSDFSQSIDSYVKSADIILLLVSSDFLASDYCYEIELKEALNRHQSGQAVVIPVILRPCDWHGTSFGSLLATPTDGKPVVKFPTLDDAFLEVTQSIKKVAERLSNKDERSKESSTENVTNKKDLPRSSNLRIRKAFRDHDKDAFLDQAFDYIARFFEGSLSELKKRNPEVSYRFKRIDAHTFTASLYRLGQVKSECMVYLGGMLGPRNISYSRNISSGRNSMNEALSIVEDENLLQLRPTGLSFYGVRRSENLTNEGAAEYFWELFLEPLQRD